MLTALALFALVNAPGRWVAGVSSSAQEAPSQSPVNPEAPRPDAESAPLQGSEDDAPHADSPAPEPLDAEPRVSSLERSARLLAEERAELEVARPRILLPILLTTGGLGAALGGAGFIWAGLFTAAWYAFSFAVGSVVLLSIGIVLVAAGIPLTVVGAVKLHRARKERRKIDQRLERLEQEAAGMQKVLSF